MKFYPYLFAFTGFLLLVSCNETLPKPKGYLRLSYPDAKYVNYKKNNPLEFKVNTLALVKENNKGEITVEYPEMKATIFLNYRPVKNNLNSLLRDAQKLTYEHVIKADDIIEQPYINSENKVFGMFYKIGGNAASNSQFYLTDSTKHFLLGSVYFYAKPHFDSILPAAHYIEEDMRILIESLKWKK
jgi:gliding motility-associated lipoprotein GldD